MPYTFYSQATSYMTPTKSAVHMSLSKTTMEAAVEYRTLADHPEFLPQIYKQMKMQEFVDNCPDHGVGGYHNQAHTDNVVLNAYEGSLWERLPVREARALMIAALYHDAGHQSHIRHDAYNVQHAIDRLKRANAMMAEHVRLDDEQLKWACSAIKATQWPHTGNSPETISGVLRDADHMLPLAVDASWQLRQLVGLWNETSPYISHSFGEFVRMQEKYYTLRRWHSRWGQIKALKLNYPHCAKRCMQLIQDNKHRFV